MKNLITKLIILTFATNLIFASNYEYPQLYKDPKNMGMGGVGIATDGGTSSLFYNTASLRDMKKNDWNVDILAIDIAVGENMLDFIEDMGDANDLDGNEETKKMLEVTENYLGENLHFGASLAPFKLGKRFGQYSMAVATIAGLHLNTKTHRGSGSAGLVEMSGLFYNGVVVGGSKDINSVKLYGFAIKDISVGAGVKILNHKTISAQLALSDLVDDNLSDRFEDDYTKDGSDVVLDLGIKAKVYRGIVAGASIQNMGGIASGDEEIPMTVNTGVSYKQKFKRVWLNSYQVGFDYVDILHSYNQDSDILKRTRLGATANIINSYFGDIEAQIGFYQTYLTYGFNFRAGALKIAYASYQEEVGAATAQDGDQRQILQFSIGW